METKTIIKKQGTLNLRDWFIGAVIAVVTGVLTALLTGWESGKFVPNWAFISAAAVSALSAYLGKNAAEPSKTVTITKE